MPKTAELDIIVYGATGYTGQLVADYIQRTYGESDVKWGMAGRDETKLQRIRDEVGAPKSLPLFIANADQPETLTAMTGAAKCVISTVGPYTLYGMPLVDACVETGTDYVDLCGEPLWMVETIEKYSAAAKQSGARIVHSCGFDSIPTDLGVYLLQERARERFGHPMPRIRGRVRKMKGTFSGGTAASMKATMAKVMKDPSLKEALMNPFALCEGFQGPQQPADHVPKEDTALGVWVAPFVMATINTKNIHRSNMLLGHPYGKDFAYDEMAITGPGDAGKAAAGQVAKAGLGGGAEKKPGEGPTKEERETGFFDFLIHGNDANGNVITFGVTGDRDPGYGSTSKMLTESALCLVREAAGTAGGVWTPAAAMGNALRDRLVAHAGLTFDEES